MSSELLGLLKDLAPFFEVLGGIVAFFAAIHFAIPARYKKGNRDYYSDVESAIREFQSRRRRMIRLTLILLGLAIAALASWLFKRFEFIGAVAGYLEFAALFTLVLWMFFYLYVCRCPACGKQTHRSKYSPIFPSRCPSCKIRLTAEDG